MTVPSLLAIKMRHHKAQKAINTAVETDEPVDFDPIVESFNDIPDLLGYVEDLRGEVSRILHMWHAAETKVVARNEELYRLKGE